MGIVQALTVIESALSSVGKAAYPTDQNPYRTGYIVIAPQRVEIAEPNAAGERIHKLGCLVSFASRNFVGPGSLAATADEVLEALKLLPGDDYKLLTMGGVTWFPPADGIYVCGVDFVVRWRE